MDKYIATELAGRFSIDLKANFHTLDNAAVMRIIEAADVWKYRKPTNANGSRARYFHAFLARAAHPATEVQYVVQQYLAPYGWEDLCAALDRKEARDDIRAYRDNAPGAYRLIKRRVKL